MIVGFIGLGVMGEPMCRNLVTRSGHEVVVHDLKPEAVQRLVAEGAQAASSVAEVAGQAEVILLSLPGGDELSAVVAGAGGLLSALEPGQLVVDHTTAPVEMTRRLAAQVEELGADYCDAPIARTRQAAHDGTLSIMVGARPDPFARLRPLLEWMATDITHCGGIGSGQVTKILNNMMLFQNVRAIAEAHAIVSGLDETLGADLNLDVATVFDVIAEASGGSFALKNHGKKAILADNYPTEAFSTVYALKDLGYAIDLAEQVGVEATGAQQVHELMEVTREAGFGQEYWPVLRRML